MASLLETDMIGALILLVVGIVAIILFLLLFKEYMATKKPYHLAWGISFLVLFISGVLIILLGWEDTLGFAIVPPVAAFIPACLAIGLVFAVWPDTKYGLFYAIYCLFLIGILTLMKLELFLADMASFALMASHIPSGLIISFLPLYTAFVSKETEWTSAFFSFGGLLISFGGVLLAFATVEGMTAILPLADIFVVLPFLLLIVVVLFVLGIGLPSKWKVEIPYISGLF
ncbi:MAG: hypothetical protein ACFFAE_11570 [Candidatus Hodarchaeota archaeon]